MRRLCTLASVAFAFSGSGIAAELTAAPAATRQKAIGTGLCQIGQPSLPDCTRETVR